MSVISIITPVYKPVPEQLLAAYRSLQEQRMPEGWAWEWIVQEDGETDAACSILPEDERVSISRNRHSGVAITRNLGLARARGSLVKNLDQDDILTPGVLGRDIQVMTENPEVQWVTSRVLDLLPDGSTVGFENDPPEGPLAPGLVLRHWQEHNYRLPVHPTTICIRRDLLVALGGWMSVPGSDDTGMLIAASVVSTGYFVGEVGLLYRKWPGQVTAGASHTEPVEWKLRMSLIEERGRTLAALQRPS
ncbi:Glycosyl transferase family 2 [Micromonospora echinaurantiaca]|uniref:Glycosyl transferase family 2 n=1 Tax=Micromonospora echinaurantiaca TaxID=47857 RepID=A0A1C5JZL1_9ACTN|nr:glycosyltransferase [Micromonospora echinaurantiaca]SCG75953.1 Glycosyl transferase family 2 [Micromonospora echinaurantiaca]